MKKVKIRVVEDPAIIAMEIENLPQHLGYEVTSIVDAGEKAIGKTEPDYSDIILSAFPMKNRDIY